MAKSKKKRSGAKRAHPRRSNPGKKRHHTKRRNPEGFMDRAVKLLGGAAVVLGTGVGVTYAMAKIQPGTALSMYGIPLATFGIGAAIARKAPTIGVGMALGAATPYAVPLASRVLAATNPSSSTTAAAKTAAGIGMALRTMRAVQLPMGAVQQPPMGAVQSRYAYA